MAATTIVICLCEQLIIGYGNLYSNAMNLKQYLTLLLRIFNFLNCEDIGSLRRKLNEKTVTY